jgi:hypothetical protein
MEERRGRAPHLPGVTTRTKPTRAQDRAARLHREALNCLAIAVREEEVDHTAQLIDEALKLAKRSRELSGVE